MTSDNAVVPLERVRDSTESFDAAFSEVRPYLVGVCRSLVGDDAEDVVQDTYLAGRRRLHQLREAHLLRSWLTTIAINQCFDRHRRRQRLARVAELLRHPAAAGRDLDLRSQVEALPFRDRTVVVLHYGHGLSLEEIARVLGLKPVTVRSIAHRARQRLRRALGEEHHMKDGGSE